MNGKMKNTTLLRASRFTIEEASLVARARVKSGKLLWSLYHDAIVKYAREILGEEEKGENT